MNELTIIIPFLNEGKEVKNTLDSIFETIKGDVDVILINDSSTDGYDYEALAKEFGCKYVTHSERKGVAASRDEGVELCTTPYFLLLDGHMRFYEQGWNERICTILKQNSRAILCSQTKKLAVNEDGEVVEGNNHQPCYGGYIRLIDQEIFRVTWNYVDPHPHTSLVQIPCILGAAYAAHKSYWQKLKGLDGLIYYGTDEEFISIKTYSEGGKCLLLKDWVAGHIYRDHFPYEVKSKEVVYNRLYVIELFIPYLYKKQLFKALKQMYGTAFDDAILLLKQNYPQMKMLKDHFRSIQGRTIEEFLQYNQQCMELDNSKKQIQR